MNEKNMELEVDYSGIIANLKLICQNLLDIDKWGKGASITNPSMTIVFNEFVAPATEVLLGGIKAMEKTRVQKEMRCGDCEHFVPVEDGTEGICRVGHGVFKQAPAGLPLRYTWADCRGCVDIIPSLKPKKIPIE